MRVARFSTALVALAVAAAATVVPSSTANPNGERDRRPGGDASSSAVIATKVLGKSARGRPIRAWQLGHAGEQNDASVPTVVLISTDQVMEIFEAVRSTKPPE